MNASLPTTYSPARPVGAVGAYTMNALVLLVGLLSFGYNMFGYPLFLGDEGIYMSQAWAVLKQGTLTPYTYWYDHAPAGWLLIALWTLLTGGFSTFGTAVDGGRVLMLLLHLGSLYLVTRITLRLSESLLAAAVAGLLYALSPLSVVYGRMVLLDNIMVFWLLLSAAYLMRHDGELWPLLGSAACFGIAVLTKETALLLVPAFGLGLLTMVAREHARFARAGWIFIAISIVSLYPLFAALKKELVAWSLSSPLAGQSGEVSLLGSILWQLGRTGGAPWNPQSDFYQALTTRWLVFDRWLLVAGVIATLWCLIRGPRGPRVVGLLSLCSLLVLVRGGVVLEFYILVALPWLACCIGLLVAALARTRLPLLGPVAALGAVALTSHSLYTNRDVFLVDLTTGQRQALEWVQRHVPAESRLIIDDDIWVDLRNGAADAPVFPHAHSHWKAALDPSIWVDFFDDNWRNVDYLVLTPGLKEVWAAEPERFPWRVYEQSMPVASFGTGDAQIEVRKVLYPGHAPRAALAESWEGFKQRFIVEGQVRDADGQVEARNQATALLMAVWMDDRAAFDELWSWTKLHMQDQRGLLYGNTSSDRAELSGQTEADTDVAMALLMAQNRWGNKAYGAEGASIVRAIRDHYIVEANGKPVLAAGDWAIGTEQVIFAPAAFSPAAYHLFAGVDPTYNWWYVLDTNYHLLARASQLPVGTERSAGLPPTFVGVDRDSGELATNGRGLPKEASAFTTDAARVYWRVALDARLHDDGRADSFLGASAFLHDEWRRKSELFSQYAHNGQPLARNESFTLYSAVLPKFAYGNQRFDDALYATKIAPEYNARHGYALWGDGTSIAEQQMAWLAVGLYGQAINDDWSNKAPRITVTPVRSIHRSIAL